MDETSGEGVLESWARVSAQAGYGQGYEPPHTTERRLTRFLSWSRAVAKVIEMTDDHLLHTWKTVGSQTHLEHEWYNQEGQITMFDWAQLIHSEVEKRGLAI